MRTTTCAAMTAAIERILCSYDQLQDFLNKPSFGLRIQAASSRLIVCRKGLRVFISQEYIQINKCGPIQPSMEFELAQKHLWKPVEIRFVPEGHPAVNSRRINYSFPLDQRDINQQIEFSDLWARNLLDSSIESGRANRFA